MGWGTKDTTPPYGRAATLAVATIVALLTGCGSTPPPQEGAVPPAPSQSPDSFLRAPSEIAVPSTPSEQPDVANEVVTVEQAVPEEWSRDSGPRPDVSADLVARVGGLGMDLWQYQRAQDPGGDVWVSPVSVYQALSLLAPGVGDQAIDELLTAMRVPAGDLGANTGELSDWITASRRSDYRMAIHNAAFVSRQYGGFAPGYLQAIEPIRDELGGFDPRDPQGTADFVNSRVAAHTRGVIEEILSPGDITADLAAILLNTTCFKGAWVYPFDPVLTDEVGDFTLLDGSVVTIESMAYMSMPLAVSAGDGFTAAVLPYEGGANAVIVLPDAGRFDEVAAGLTAAGIRNLAAADVGETPYYVDLPKFTSDSGIQELIPALRSVGVRQAFAGTPSWPMFGNEDEHEVSFVKHRVVVAVNELGTEAAAATAVGGIGSAEGPELTFIVNRPFLMAVLDADDALLFMGQVTDPR